MVSVLEIKKRLQKEHPFMFWGAAMVAAVFLFCFSFYIYISYLIPIPAIFDANDYPTTKIFDRNGQLLYEVLQPDFGKRTIIPIDQFPDSFINATLAAEDINFYSHPGVDFWAIGRAIFFNVREQRIVSGASTITQQLVRNIIGSNENRNIYDKALEAIYAVRITNEYSKDEILELYLNRIYYGNMAYGAQSAAQDYFGKNINDLDLAESSFIAGLPQSPSRYNPFVSFENAKNRQKYVLDQMVKNEFISDPEAEAAYDEPLYLRPNKHLINAPHFVLYVLNELETEYGNETVRKGGLQVYTTLDLNLQIEAERIIERRIADLERNNVNNAALVATDVDSGQVLAWVGSADYFDEEIDGAVDIVTSLRQPGSSIKPLTYLLAFEKGYTPATVIFDVPTQFETETGPYSPKNYDLDYHGPVRVRTALASSFNIPAVKTLEYVGVGDFIAFLRKLGIETLNQPASHYGLALTLGGGEVRMIDMVRAYLVLANMGDRFDYSTILEIKDASGERVYEWSLQNKQYVLGPNGRAHAFQIIDILSDRFARIPGFGEGGVLEVPFAAAVKTGTTRNFRDNWTIGFSPKLLTAVWVGNADASPMENISGIDGAAPIWSDFMRAYHEKTPAGDFVKPDTIKEVEICEISGLLPTDLCENRIYEYFVNGSEPKEPDNYYQLFTINKQTGQIVPGQCVSKYLPHEVERKVLVAYPAELQKWAEQRALALPQYEPCALSNDNPVNYSNGYTPDNADSILIETPANNDEYQIQSGLPLDAQKVPFRVVTPSNTLKVDYIVDDELAGTASNKPYTYLWLPTKGDHVLSAEAELNTGEKITSNRVFFKID